MLGVGVIPTLATVYLRTKIPETPHFVGAG